MIQGGGFAIGMQQKTTDAPIEKDAILVHHTVTPHLLHAKPLYHAGGYVARNGDELTLYLKLPTLSPAG